MTVSNLGTEVDFLVAQGSDFSALLQMFESDGTTPVDVTRWSFVAEVKLSAPSSIVYAVFSVVTTDPSLGKLTLSLAAADTALLPAGDTIQGQVEGSYVWDLKATDTGSLVSRPFFGKLTVQVGVTP